MTITWRDAVSLTVEVGFASNPSVDVATTTWTDVSTYVRSISTRRGRNDELGTFSAGTMSVVLDNRDRRFDPNYTSSPYSPNVVPMRRIRLKATYNAVTYAVWSGFVDDWPQEYDIGGHEATVTVNCTDGFKVLSLLKASESVYAYRLPFDTPVAWWRLGEESGTTAADSSGNGHNGVYAGGATFNSGAGLVADSSDKAIRFDGVDDMMSASTPVTAFPFTIEAWISTTTTAAATWLNMRVTDSGAFNTTYNCDFRIGALSPGVLRVEVTPSGRNGGYWYTDSATLINDGNPHHVVATFASNSASPTLYIDGAAEGASSSTSATGRVNAGVTIGGDSVDKADATIDEVAIYSSSLSAATILNHYEFGSDPWAGDGTGARVGRLLDLVAWPAADRTVATGISTLQAADLRSAAIQQHLQQVELSEQGQLYMSGDGKVVFRDRHWRFETSAAITSQATFGDSGSELRYADIETDGGEQFLFNHVRAARDGGATVDVTDSTSITKYFERLEDVSGLQNQSDLEVNDLANWRLATHKNPVPRVVSLVVKPRRSPTTLFPQVLGRDIGERLTVKRRPQGLGSALTYTVLLEGIEHTITPAEWQTRWYLSSSDSQTALQPLILDDATFGLLDSAVLAF